MGPRLASALIAGTALLVAGCGDQFATSGGGSGQPTKTINGSPSTQQPARQYLLKRVQKREGDYEGPENPRSKHNPKWSYHVVLAGSKAIPRTPLTSVTAHVTLRGSRVCWRIGRLPKASFSGAFGRVRKPLVPTTAEIHVGAKGKNGPAVAVFGARYKAKGCVVVRPVAINAIAASPRFYYLNLVSARYPKGALRAQL